MAKGGRRQGAGRKPQYLEPVQKVLIGLPKSMLKRLDQFAKRKKSSRPRAIALLLEQLDQPEEKILLEEPLTSFNVSELLGELRALRDEMHTQA